MYQVFKSLIVSNIVIKNIDLYGCVVGIDKKLSNDIVRKRLADCFINVRKHDKDEEINGHYFYKDCISHWLGYLLHRDGRPACINDDRQSWYQYGKLHRDNDVPAHICGNYKVWYKNGKMHRDNDKPARISDDRQSWYQYDELHRDNDMPAVIDECSQQWYRNGKLHRDNDKPAYICCGYKLWYKNGKRYYPDLKK